MIIFNLEKLTKSRNITMTELSERTGISRTSLSQLSTGKTQGVQFKTLDKLLTALDCPINDLILHIKEVPFDLSIDVTTDSYTSFEVHTEEINGENETYLLPTLLSIVFDLKINIKKTDFNLSFIAPINAVYSFTGPEGADGKTILDFKYDFSGTQLSQMFDSKFLDDTEIYELKKLINNELLDQAKTIYSAEVNSEISVLESLYN